MRRATAREREEFISALLKAVPTAKRSHALRLLRWGATYGRLAEAECNGDWPAENGEGTRYQCPKCEAGWRIRSALKECPSCRAERIIRETCANMGLIDPIYWKASTTHSIGRGDWWAVPHFQGDPRGHTVRLQIADAPLDPYERPALAVPTS